MFAKIGRICSKPYLSSQNTSTIPLSKKNPLLVDDCGIPKCHPWYLCLLNREMQVVEFQNPHIIDSLMTSRRRVYSSNSLLCVELISKYQHSFWLWNPSIREARPVPNSLDNYEMKYFSVGFGFSPIVDDYKIVKLFTSDYLVVEVEVYASRTGLWRKVELGNLEGVYVTRPSRFTCNGAIFWFGEKGGIVEEERKRLIVSFDIAMEVFTLIPFPTMTSAPESCFNRLTMYENKLAMLSPTVIEDSESCLIDLWVLGEDTDVAGERWSWTKIYTSKPIPYTYSISPEIIWRNEIVCGVNAISESQFGDEQGNHEAEVVLCNLATDEFNMFAIQNVAIVIRFSIIRRALYYLTTSIFDLLIISSC